MDLPTPLGEAPNGTDPTAIVAFRGGYVAVGTVWLAGCWSCTGGIPPFFGSHPTRGDYASVDASRNRSVVWTSTDGRIWTLHDHIPELEHAALHGLVTDGARLVAYGSYLAPHGAGNYRPAVDATWASFDGLSWTRGTGRAPAAVAAAEPGRFVGALSIGTNCSATMPLAQTVQFAVSSDGLSWTTTSPAFEATLGGPAPSCGSVSLAATRSGSAIALGTVPSTGNPTEIVLWRSVDGLAWSPPEPLTAFSWANSISAVATDSSLFAQDLSLHGEQVENEVWRVPPSGPIPKAPSTVFGAGDSGWSVYASGTTVLTFGVDDKGDQVNWISTDDGRTWNQLGGPFDKTTTFVTALATTPDAVLATAQHFTFRDTSDGTLTIAAPELWMGR
jgi:hypothetical protein